MAICERCGVEIDDSADTCPLCGTELSDSDGKGESEPVSHQILPEFVDEIRPLNVKQRARLTWEISTLMFISAVIVVLFVDLISNRRITWSVYPIIATGFVWALSSLASFFYRYPVVLFVGAYINMLAFLLLIDIATSGHFWFVLLGLPITTCLFLVLGVLFIIAPRIDRRGLNIPAFILLGIGLFTMGIESTVDWYLFRAVSFTWSGLVLVSVCPVAIILLFVHYRLRKYVDLKRFFHL